MKTLYIVRGLPGSGKSTLSKNLVWGANHKEADMYHMVDGEYRFDINKAKEAHAWCLNEIKDLMNEGEGPLAVSNTFTRRWEYQPYIDAAKNAGYDVCVIDCYGPWENTHGVPEETMVAMKNRWEPHSEDEECISV